MSVEGGRRHAGEGALEGKRRGDVRKIVGLDRKARLFQTEWPE